MLMAAHWVREGWLLVPAGGEATEWRLHAAPAGGISPDGGRLVTPPDATTHGLFPAEAPPPAVASDFPALVGWRALRLPLTRAEAERVLTGQLVVAGYHGGRLTAAHGVQLPGVLDDLYAAKARAREFGVSWQAARPSLALWAPTARRVALRLWPTDGPLTAEPQVVAAARQPDGSWVADGEASWRDARYLWEVEVYVPATGRVETNVVTDPYSAALTRGSTHSVIIDLTDPRWAPPAWLRTPSPRVERQVDQAIYELHVRDFSVSDQTVPEPLRGTFRAFTLPDTAGVRALAELKAAGLTTIHLLPTFNIATLPDRSQQAVVDENLDAYPPDSASQQGLIGEIADRDGFNWGYDPLHWSVPEGSYCTDPEGGARTREFREAIAALHGLGLQVVLDVVYNHTAAHGQHPDSVWDRVVPGYYHRQCGRTGEVLDSTCCSNIATEHAMAGRAMVDSLVRWARHYHVDGFRFDLMGHHSRQNLLDVRAALDGLTLTDDGVDGRRLFLYGEGWNFGEVKDDALFVQARQGNLGGTGIGTFNDRLRDGVLGGSPVDQSTLTEPGFGTGLACLPVEEATGGPSRNQAQASRLGYLTDLVKLSLAGNLRDFRLLCHDGVVRRGDEIDYHGVAAGYADSPTEVISYVDAHDNETLYDIGVIKRPRAGLEERVRRNTLMLATVALAQTPLFWHAGTERLRSKSLDRDSYNSGDWFNLLDWTGQENGFGRGLPPAWANLERWPLLGPLLADPALRPTPAHIAEARRQALRLLRLRRDTPQLRLGSAELIKERVHFPAAPPGVIVMEIADPRRPLRVVLNATQEEQAGCAALSYLVEQ
ncbi:MAG: pullulanase-type alpha-1,6-glucosidase [Promicromonosporaceae bacterium]|nr:pullulanase-type alpha-1,6-glucosidase [Promicromonosporaceae bacterium]